MARARRPAGTPHPWRRSADVGTCGVLLGALGHQAGGGDIAVVPLLLVAAAFVCGLRTQAHREWGREFMLVSVLASQLASHAVLSLTCGHATTTTSTMLVAHLAASVLAAAWLRDHESHEWFRWRLGILRRRRPDLRGIPLPSLPSAALRLSPAPAIERPILRRLPDRRGPPALLPT